MTHDEQERIVAGRMLAHSIAFGVSGMVVMLAGVATVNLLVTAAGVFLLGVAAVISFRLDGRRK